MNSFRRKQSHALRMTMARECRGKVLSKQFLRSGTSIGANCSEAVYAQSTKDFISKYSIALKEANETRYWINLMVKSEIVSQTKFEPMLKELEEIIKILTASLRKLKATSKEK